MSEIERLELENSQMELRLASFKSEMTKRKNTRAKWGASIVEKPLMRYASDVLANRRKPSEQANLPPKFLVAKEQQSVKLTGNSMQLSKSTTKPRIGESTASISSEWTVPEDMGNNLFKFDFSDPCPPKARRPNAVKSSRIAVNREKTGKTSAIQVESNDAPKQLKEMPSLDSNTQFDEDASHASFAAALEEWRQSKKPTIEEEEKFN